MERSNPSELNSPAKHDVFKPIIHTPKSVILIGYKWFFVRKQLNCLNEYLLKKGFKKDDICHAFLLRKKTSEFVIIAVYVDDLNIIDIPEEVTNTTTYLKNEFEIKDLGKTKFGPGL